MLLEKNPKSEERRKQKKLREKHTDRLQRVIHVKFKNKSLLQRAVTHRSYVNESGKNARDNERLEYLGDSVLALVVNEYLFKHFEDYQEGKLAKIKSAVVSEATLARLARKIDLGEFILMGRGEEHSGGRERPSILANTLEAVIGAVFLDQGLKSSRKFVLALIKDEIEIVNNPSSMRDPKTALQEYVQKKYKARPIYEVIDERGPDHRKEFTVRLLVNGREIVTGEGPSKRKAEMNAARISLQKIEDGTLDV
ncbi:MAG TPA: ribonuclease III [Spirochaetota bacterium]|nr:ribonuclease III [Spirochaetota bacterium]HPG50847.1 ribonuclease III [Spirochaetota bacterium]HPN13669.1 ribonuclease III [Spirochaetota bacterium]HQL80683.1 ribonuclease III [Spirochaetota bacterium]